jgi:hypothetical protein
MSQNTAYLEIRIESRASSQERPDGNQNNVTDRIDIEMIRV